MAPLVQPLSFYCDSIVISFPPLLLNYRKREGGLKLSRHLRDKLLWDQTLAPYYLTEREGCCNPNFRSVNTEKKETDTENNFCDVKQNINN